MLSVFAGRVIRYMITAILTIEYGPEIVNIAGRLATRHRIALSAGVIALLALLCYWVWRTMWNAAERRTEWSWRVFPSRPNMSSARCTGARSSAPAYCGKRFFQIRVATEARNADSSYQRDDAFGSCSAPSTFSCRATAQDRAWRLIQSSCRTEACISSQLISARGCS